MGLSLSKRSIPKRHLKLKLRIFNILFEEEQVWFDSGTLLET
jgi:hypothetical protein